MISTFTELLAGKAAAAIFDEMISDLKNFVDANGNLRPFPVNDWNEGAVPRTLLEVWSLALERVYTRSLPAITAGGFLLLAPYDWLVVLAKNIFGIDPFPADYTYGKVKFFCAASAGPYNIQGGTTVTTDTGLLYTATNTTPIVLPSGGSVWIPVRAEKVGSAYNVLQNQIRRLVTSLPGVTVDNVPEPPQTSWITLYGRDAELKEELVARCVYRFGRLSKLQNYPEEGYISLVRDLVPSVKKVTVFTNYYQGFPRPGCATLFLAGDTGPVTAQVVAEVIAKIGPYRNPLGVQFVESCRSVDALVEGVVELEPNFVREQVEPTVLGNIQDYQRRAQIGARIYGAQIIEEVMTPTGVKNFKPARDHTFQLGRNEVVNFLPRLEYVTAVR